MAAASVCGEGEGGGMEVVTSMSQIIAAKTAEVEDMKEATQGTVVCVCVRVSVCLSVSVSVSVLCLCLCTCICACMYACLCLCKCIRTCMPVLHEEACH